MLDTQVVDPVLPVGHFSSLATCTFLLLACTYVEWLYFFVRSTLNRLKQKGEALIYSQLKALDGPLEDFYAY